MTGELWCARCGCRLPVQTSRYYDHGCVRGLEQLDVWELLREHWSSGNCPKSVIWGAATSTHRNPFRFSTATKDAYL